MGCRTKLLNIATSDVNVACRKRHTQAVAAHAEMPRGARTHGWSTNYDAKYPTQFAQSIAMDTHGPTAFISLMATRMTLPITRLLLSRMGKLSRLMAVGHTAFSATLVVVLSMFAPTVRAQVQTFNDQLVAADATQSGRISRNGQVASCAAAKSLPALVTSPGLRAYKAYSVTNSATIGRCYYITLTTPNAASLAAVAYSGSFSPTNPQVNYLGDSGSTATDLTFSINVAAGATLVVVVHGMDASGAGSGVGVPYTLRVGTTPPAPTIASLSPTALPPGGGTLTVTGRHLFATGPLTATVGTSDAFVSSRNYEPALDIESVQISVAAGDAASTRPVTLSTAGGVAMSTLTYGATVPYTFTASTGASIPAGGALVSGTQLDNTTVTTTAPFNFRIYDSQIVAGNGIGLSTNGNIQFFAAGANASENNIGLPSPTLAGAALAPYWDDLDLNLGGGGIYTQVTGTAPNRRFIVEWRGRRVGDGSAVVNTVFAVTFFELSDEFQFDYVQTGVGTFANGSSATVGIQGGNTTTSLQSTYSRDQGLITAGLVLRVAPIKPLTHEVTFGDLPTAATVGTTPTSIAVTSSRGQPITLVSISPDVCTTDALSVTLVGGGTCSVVALAAGQGTYTQLGWYAAARAQASFSVRSSQNFEFDALPNRIFGGPLNPNNTFTLTSRTLAGPDQTEYASATPAVCTISPPTRTLFGVFPGQVVTLVSLGTCTISASHPGGGVFLPAGPIVRSFTVVSAAQQTQSVNFAVLPNQNLPVSGNGSVAISATATSGLAVTFTSLTTTVCTVSTGALTAGSTGATITLLVPGTCTIRASQVGDATFSAAADVDRSFTVSPARQAQTISFTAPGTQTLPGAGNGSAALSATATSGLVVAFTTTTATICTVSAGTLNTGATVATATLLAPGTCTIRASQAGNASFLAAADVERSFTVNAPTCESVPTNDCDADGIPNSVEIAQGTNPLAKDNDVFPDTQAGLRLFLMQFYRDVLGREADAGGLQYWTCRMNKTFSSACAQTETVLTRADITVAFLFSPEALQGRTLTGEEAVTRLYVAMLRRNPDPAGLAFWAARFTGPQSLTPLAQAFIDSAEYRGRFLP